MLGFKHRPSYKTIWHWLNKRVGFEGLETIHTTLMQHISQALAAQGITIAEKVTGDTTPIQAKQNRPRSRLQQPLQDALLPRPPTHLPPKNLTLEWIVTLGNVDEGQFMVPFLAKVKADGFNPKEAVFDNGYAGYWNYEIPNLMSIKLQIGFRENAKPSWRGKPETLKLRYKKMVTEEIS